MTKDQKLESQKGNKLEVHEELSWSSPLPSPSPSPLVGNRDDGGAKPPAKKMLATPTNNDSDNNLMDKSMIQANRYSSIIKKRQERIHAFKVGFGVLIALVFVLVEELDSFFQHTGAWAVITAAIVILPTPGETTKKMVNRVVGTTAACALAVLIGLAGNELSRLVHPLGHVMIACINFTVALVATHKADQGGTWAYAYLLGMITFCFLSSSILVEDDIWIGIFRATMIAIGGIIGLLVAWLPPTTSATNLAQAYLADALLDTCLAAEVLIDNFLEGHQLVPIHQISEDPEQDDTFHMLSKSIQVSRVPLEAALKASSFEGLSRKDHVASMRLSGLAVRLTLRSLMAADVLLRQQYHPLHVANNEEEAKLGLALRGVVSSIRSTMITHKMIDGNQLPQVAFLLSSRDDEEAAGWKSGELPGIPLSQSLADLESCLQQYVQKQHDGPNHQQHEPMMIMQRFACHVGFARNIYDAGKHFGEVLPHLIACDIGSTTHSSTLTFDLF